MLAFAANSLLARAALADGGIDAASFTAIRIVSGAVALALLLAAQRRGDIVRARPGSWASAIAILAYALAFSLAYRRLGAATGAVILFAAVQGTMVLWGIVRADRPTPAELAGLAVAFAAFVWLLLPGLDTPDLAGSVLMIAAGIAWGIYSLRGRGAGNPLDATAGNFVRAAILCLPFVGTPFMGGHASLHGLTLAIFSGAITSGLGYVIWYRALPGLTTTQGATVQLTVPMLAAFGGIVLLGETMTLRLAVASACILGGVALAIAAKAPGTGSGGRRD
ncbi:MAG: DMT family transporter [Proteobacteria bacterium]|nr:DMT family transporter [Pseudomonadota bacterium]